MPTFRDDAVEIAAIVAAMRAGEVEPTHVVQNALNVLAQVIVAAVSVDDWKSEDLYRLVRRSYPYHQLTRSAFDEVLAMLSGKYPSDIAAELEPRITWDRVNDRLIGSRAARMTAVISGGTIPDRGLYTGEPSRSHATRRARRRIRARIQNGRCVSARDRLRGGSLPSSTIEWSSRRHRAPRRGCLSGTASTWRDR